MEPRRAFSMKSVHSGLFQLGEGAHAVGRLTTTSRELHLWREGKFPSANESPSVIAGRLDNGRMATLVHCDRFNEGRLRPGNRETPESDYFQTYLARYLVISHSDECRPDSVQSITFDLLCPTFLFPAEGENSIRTPFEKFEILIHQFYAHQYGVGHDPRVEVI